VRDGKSEPVTTALALARLGCWQRLDHEQRRFAYETVAAMRRMRVPSAQYAEFMAWIEARASTRNRRW
jgi:hypothetical protein